MENNTLKGNIRISMRKIRETTAPDKTIFFYKNGTVQKKDTTWRLTAEDYSAKTADQLIRVVIGQNTTEIGAFAFKGCTALLSVIIPNGLIMIDEKAFYLCTSLRSITVPNSVKWIGSQAFLNCKSLNSVIFSSCTRVESGVFNGCGIMQKRKTETN